MACLLRDCCALDSPDRAIVTCRNATTFRFRCDERKVLNFFRRRFVIVREQIPITVNSRIFRRINRPE